MKLEILNQDHIEVYASPVGYCCIRQRDEAAQIEQIVLISPAVVDQLCSFLQTVREEAIRNRAKHIEWCLKQRSAE